MADGSSGGAAKSTPIPQPSQGGPLESVAAMSRPDWPQALRALGRLARDGDPQHVYEITRTLNGPSRVKGYKRLLMSLEGGRIAYERPELAQTLTDDDWLDSLPRGSVGSAYRTFMRQEQFSAEGLVEGSRQGYTPIDDVHPYAWFGRRVRDLHDIWHVLAGYGRDPLGELCLFAFTFAQTRGAGWGLLAAAGALKVSGIRRHPHAWAVVQAYRNGRRARWLMSEDYDRLLMEPLEAARQRLRLQRPTVYDAIPPAERAV